MFFRRGCPRGRSGGNSGTPHLASLAFALSNFLIYVGRVIPSSLASSRLVAICPVCLNDLNFLGIKIAPTNEVQGKINRFCHRSGCGFYHRRDAPFDGFCILEGGPNAIADFLKVSDESFLSHGALFLDRPAATFPARTAAATCGLPTQMELFFPRDAGGCLFQAYAPTCLEVQRPA